MEHALTVSLISMPWAPVELPSLALGLLSASLEAEVSAVRHIVRYANVEWLTMLQEAGVVGGYDEYAAVVSNYYSGLGEWVFSNAYYRDTPAATSAYFAEHLAGTSVMDWGAEMYALAPGFVDMVARTVLNDESGIVGLTSTFDQNMASFALARALRVHGYAGPIVMGGANCDGDQADGILAAIPEIDLAQSGPGEDSLVVLARALAEGGRWQELAKERALPEGLRSRSSWPLGLIGGRQLGAPLARRLRSGVPDHSAYFSAIRRTTARVPEPALQIEGSRGCWWGEKSQCTFCGLNGSEIAYREKSTEDLLTEVDVLVRRHQSLDLVFSDNILSRVHMRDLLPQLEAAGWDLTMFFEVKANMNFGELVAAASAGATQLQVGVESLVTDTLGLMRKGVRGYQNVRVLRDCATLSVYPGWNWLYGFPGETEPAYEASVSQVAKLEHLTPPEGAYRIVLTRFSPYFENPALGLENCGPSRALQAIYRLPVDALGRFCYVFDSTPAGVSDSFAGRLRGIVRDWKERHSGARLVGLLEEDERLRIIDTRARFGPVEHHLDQIETVCFRRLWEGRFVPSWVEEVRGFGVSAPRAESWLESWDGLGLTYLDGDYAISLPTGSGQSCFVSGCDA